MNEKEVNVYSFCCVLGSAIVIGGLYALLSQTELIDYDETLVIYEETYSNAENISIY